MSYYGDNHVFISGQTTCQCGFFKNGKAPKPRFWEECILAILSNPFNGGSSTAANSIVELADFMVDNSKYIMEKLK